MSYVARRRRGFGDVVTPWDAAPIPGQTMDVSQASLDSILKATGGTPIFRPWGQTDILLPNGSIVNAGGLASVYTNPVWMGNQRIVDAEAAKVLNQDTCITEWGNVVSNCTDTPTGTFTVKGGAVSYQPGVAPVPYQAPVLSQSQYAAWQQKNAGATPVTDPTMIVNGVQVPRVAAAGAPPAAGAPNVTSSNAASSAPGGAAAGGGAQLASSFSSLVDQAQGLPLWVWAAAAGAVLLFMQGGGRGR